MLLAVLWQSAGSPLTYNTDEALPEPLPEKIDEVIKAELKKLP